MNDDDEMDRDAAEQHPCPYELPGNRYRREPLRCGADVGERCRNPSTGHALTRHAAHLPRLRLAGVAAPSQVPPRQTAVPS